MALYAIAQPDDYATMEMKREQPPTIIFLQDVLTHIEHFFFDRNSPEKARPSQETPLLPTYSRKNTEHDEYVNEFKFFVKQKHPSISGLPTFKEHRSNFFTRLFSVLKSTIRE